MLMGLPFFSGIMASADAVLVSGATWIAIVTWLRTALTENRLARGLTGRLRGTRRRPDGADRPQAAEHAEQTTELDEVHART